MRNLLILFPVMLLMALTTSVTAQDQPLRELADARDIYIGAAAQSGLLEGDYADVLSREFNLLTTEWETKMCVTHPTATTYDFTGTDKLVEFAEEHQMVVRGHTLLWHECFPDWLASDDYTRDEAIDIMREYIHTVVERYKGRIAIWDVVNEAITDNGLFRSTPWYRMIGEDYIELAFRFAHEADPDVLLFYNDYGAEVLNRKSDRIYKLVSDMLENEVPIDGVGLQMHLQVGDVGDRLPINRQAVTENINRLGDLGLQVHITELDLKHPGKADESVLEQQAQNYRDVVEICLSAEPCTAIIVWGVTDRYSWIKDFDNNPDAAPLLFDEDYQPKPAYTAVQQALAEFTTDDQS
ncbi:MAG: endo-1,4-beta-xylanase [Anaerolineae bacterium]|nr:endo-1,4-beta-xylanase [Anaerolineae bacterium]